MPRTRIRTRSWPLCAKRVNNCNSCARRTRRRRSSGATRTGSTHAERRDTSGSRPVLAAAPRKLEKGGIKGNGGHLANRNRAATLINGQEAEGASPDLRFLVNVNLHPGENLFEVRSLLNGVQSAAVVGPPGQEIHVDELGRVLGEVATLGAHERDRIADEAGFTFRERRPRRCRGAS